MKINLNAIAVPLDQLAEKMRAPQSGWRIAEAGLSPRQKILIELEKGVEISIEEVKTSHGGLLTYKGEQVILYIKHTRTSEEKILEDIDNAPKFHLYDCSTLEHMRNIGREDRYVVTNNTSGEFSITTLNRRTRENREMSARLHVCKKCLGALNWQGYANFGNYLNRNKIRDKFNLKDFLAEYSTFFRSKPRYTDKTAPPDGYAPNWSQEARACKVRHDWVCQECGVRLHQHKRLLHAHHKNGVISDNSKQNLEPLCILCHAAQPAHERMKPSDQDRQIIEQLCREQGL